MKCNKCGSIVGDNAKFCTKCGNDLRNQTLNDDGFIQEVPKNIEDDQSFLERLTSSKEFYPICWGVFIFIVLIGLICGINSINFSEFVKEKTTPKAENCEASNVKDIVIDIVKKNDYFYNDIDPDTISTVYLRYPAVTGYEKDIDKYHCTGQFVVESVYGGFKPLVNDYKNHYYSKFHSYYDLYDDKLTRNTTYVCDVKYSSQLSEGSTLVESTYCSSGGGWYDSGKSGKFSCDGEDCEPILIHKRDRENVEDTDVNTSTQNSNVSAGSNYNSSYTNNNYSPVSSTAPQPKPQLKPQNSLRESENAQNYDQIKQNNKKNIEDAENELF